MKNNDLLLAAFVAQEGQEPTPGDSFLAEDGRWYFIIQEGYAYQGYAALWCPADSFDQLFLVLNCFYIRKLYQLFLLGNFVSHALRESRFDLDKAKKRLYKRVLTLVVEYNKTLCEKDQKENGDSEG